MTKYPIQQIFQQSFLSLSASFTLSPVQKKAAHAILNCKTGALGFSVSQCQECGHLELHSNSCRNRNCPNCQAVQNEIWVDKRREEVMDSPYFHVVFTLPHELNSLIYCNQKLLYGLFHRCCSQTLLELSQNPRYLGAVPGIIQVLHTWNQELNYHVHMHCIVSGGGLTRTRQIKTSKETFFIPVRVLRDKFKGKYLSLLEEAYRRKTLVFSGSCEKLRNSYEWNEFKHLLYEKDWCPFIKETFRSVGNALDYLGRYTHKIAISNSRIRSITDSEVTFSARGKHPGDPKREVTLTKEEFLRRFLMHVLPDGFQKIRYYGFLNNRGKAQNLKLIVRLQGHQKWKRRYRELSLAELLKAIWKFDIKVCPKCGHRSMNYLGRVRAKP